MIAQWLIAPLFIAQLLFTLSCAAAPEAPSPPASAAPVRVAVGSKAFTESVILGELAGLLGRDLGLEVEHKKQLGGTPVVWTALLNGEIDVYPEYTGTISQEIFKDRDIQGDDDLRAALDDHGIGMTGPLGFNNTYAIGMQEKVARRLKIRTISDLREHPQLRFGFGNEFMDRGEGWPTLSRRYRLPQRDVRGLDHSLAYRALMTDGIQAMDVYSTDAKLRSLKITVLDDDLHHFPVYDAVFLYRHDLADRAPQWIEAIARLEGRISDAEMTTMNQNVEAGRGSEQRTAADFLAATLGVQVQVFDPGLIARLWRYTLDHLFLVVVSLLSAIVVAVPLGVVAAKRPAAGQVILTIAEIIQTIPGLALLVLLMPLISGIGLEAIGPAPAIVALFLYSLLPIIRNTYTGMRNVPDSLRESAAALGLTPWAQLRLIELPLASRMILAGIKTTAAINIGYATLGGLIGAGGYGDPIMTGLRLYDPALMLEGAIPAALLALAVKWLFELSERFLVPKGLRLKTSH